MQRRSDLSPNSGSLSAPSYTLQASLLHRLQSREVCVCVCERFNYTSLLVANFSSPFLLSFSSSISVQLDYSCTAGLTE